MVLFKNCRSPTKIAAQVHDEDVDKAAARPKTPDGKAPPLTKKLLKDSNFQDMDMFGEDSDASDDEAAIDRYDRDEVAEDDEVYKSRNVEMLMSKMTPEEMFVKFDEDHSGLISQREFIKMLPQLGIKLSEAKAIRIFDMCDKDRSGEIDLEEFKMAMFTVDPNTGNSLGFAPSSLLSPKDAFHLFDSNGSGRLDELEFADALEYFGMTVSDAKQEKLFQKYDSDKSGYIDYSEFRVMWLQCADLRHELGARGIEIPKYATRKTLMQILTKVLDEEERIEDQALAEAKWYHEWQMEKIRRQELARKAGLRAQDELAAALDAAGQVYVLGSGHRGQFGGNPASRDTMLYDGYTHVSDIWQARVFPTYVPPDLKLKPVSMGKPLEGGDATALDADKSPRPPTPDLIQREKAKKQAVTLESPEKKPRAPFMRRRKENVEYDVDHVSPPKLGRQEWQPKRREEEEEATAAPEETSDDTTEMEELNQKFLDDRAFVRSLRFKEMHPMTNTGWLWGRQVIQATITDNIAYAVTATGQIYCWGGQNKWWKGLAGHDDDGDDDDDEGKTKALVDETQKQVEEMRMLTARSELLKMAAPKFAAAAVALEVERQKTLLEAKRQKELADDAQYEKQAVDDNLDSSHDVGT
ncbi:Aste57867_12943 [Aphanomyces stellatus]|uniref:Aste57867_12943 protein n=1 Tax=Aphanomyces stellatus TaxID=120398 RepID=A0A485KYY0_9STRA|nr:hypothetical protein As57867_012895 [Aphanomyces stellatus]VFT89789.1 Aste57867_12943 [Aphanomyces stellatus]